MLLGQLVKRTSSVLVTLVWPLALVIAIPLLISILLPIEVHSILIELWLLLLLLVSIVYHARVGILLIWISVCLYIWRLEDIAILIDLFLDVRARLDP